MAVPTSCSERNGLRQPARCARGFSYLWVLMLVAFMGLSLVLAVDIDSTATQRDKEKELLAIGRQFRSAIMAYHEVQLMAGRPDYPATLEDLLQDRRFPGIRRHLRKVFVDPMTGRAEWGLVKWEGRIVGVHSLSDKVPIKQTGFEAEELNLAGRQKYSEWIFAYPADVLSRIRTETGEGAPRKTTLP